MNVLRAAYCLLNDHGSDIGDEVANLFRKEFPICVGDVDWKEIGKEIRR